MNKSEAIDRISSEYKIEASKINSMIITPWEKLGLIASAAARAMAQANAIRASKEQDK